MSDKGFVRAALVVLVVGIWACGSGSTGKAVTQEPAAPVEPAGTEAPVAEPEAPAGNPSDALIPRDVLFGNPDIANVQISPDGKHLSWLAAKDGVLNVWVAPRGALDQARAVTAEKERPVGAYRWAYSGTHLLYLQDSGGDENYHVHRVDLASGDIVDLTPIDGVAARIGGLSHRRPNQVLVAINDRVEALHDLYRVDLRSGERTLLVENPGYVGFYVDDDLNVRFAARMGPDGGMIYDRPGKQGAWEEYLKVGPDDAMTTAPIGFDKAGRSAYLWDSRDRDTQALTVLDLRTGKQRILAEDPRADGSGVLMHPTENTIQAVAFNYERQEWKVLDKRIEKDFARLRALADGEFAVVSRTLDDRTWVVASYSDAGPVRYYLWDRTKGAETFLFSNRKALESLELARMHPRLIPARDGLSLVSYLTLPRGADADGDGRPAAPQPMVLVVHGGPWARDSWGYNPIHQLLADRGYAALSVNFRGSTGFGKNFLNAGNREWAGKMHDDLIDAVEWAVREGVADRERVCIMGGSYGGYATLVGMTMTPEVFACGVDIVGPSSIVTLLETIPPYWAPMVEMFKTRVGDWTTPEGRAFLEERSPLSHVERIRKPLLIGQGANDPRVKQSESDQIVEAMRARGIPVTYVLYPDEGHGFARPENRLSFFAVTEAFLSAYLGGMYEPYGPETFTGSSITVPAGARAVPGLEAALAR